LKNIWKGSENKKQILNLFFFNILENQQKSNFMNIGCLFLLKRFVLEFHKDFRFFSSKTKSKISSSL